MKFLQLFLSLFLISCLAQTTVFAQTGTIAGKITDPNIHDVVIGANVRVDDGNIGAATDIEGNYHIANVRVGKHKITVSFLGYSTKVFDNVEVMAGQTLTLNADLSDDAAVMQEVVIVSKAKKESAAAVQILQRNSSTIAEGISSESIRRTPDRNAGEAIRRVSGASIQDGRFAIVRGLSDRYNIALLNGTPLPSTEPDRRAFSFDLFPSQLLDNVMIVKTASPDLPGDFAGGAILLNTKDIPEENYTNVSLSSGYNTATTFKPYYSAPAGSQNFLGLDNGSRALPGDFPASDVFKNASKTDRIGYAKMLGNDWAISQSSSARPNFGVQFSQGLTSKIGSSAVFGATVALSYANGNRLQTAMRSDFDNTGKLFDYQDIQFKNNILWGAMLNTAIKFHDRHKITLQASTTTNTDNSTTRRGGSDYEQERWVQSSAIDFTENHLTTARLGAQHTFGKDWKLNYGIAHNQSSRDVPGTRRMYYFKNFDADADEAFQAFVPYGSADPYRSGRFYSGLQEKSWVGDVDFTVPFKLFGQKQSLKMGGFYQKRDREFAARVMGFVRSRIAGFDTRLLLLPQDQIFAAENISENGFVMDEITNASDRYAAQSQLHAGYAMFENRFGPRVRATWGLRVENSNQSLNSVEYSGDSVKVGQKFTHFLPSLNLTWMTSEQFRVRFSASKSVSRPEFRELAPFSFFDFYLNGNVVGNPKLLPGQITNLDLRFELFANDNQQLSASVFYKKFENPIEASSNSSGAGSRSYTFQNLPAAQSYGVELEGRKNLGFFGAGFENLVVFANGSLIWSKLDLKNVSAFDPTRGLQGQSPYLANAGISWQKRDWGFNTTLTYNVVGDRVAQVGTTGYADVYELHRNLLDFQVGKKFGKRTELKLTVGDILRPDQVFYEDNNTNHRFDGDGDRVLQRVNFGSTISLAVSYKI